MIYTAEAQEQILELRDHFESQGRPDSVRRLLAVLPIVEYRIATYPTESLPQPTPHATLARPGRAWIKVGRYWVAYDVTRPAVLAIFFHKANIARRRRPGGK